MSKARSGHIYRHRKSGRTYFVSKIATHTETMDELVIYRQWDPPDNRVWARPRSMFEDGRFRQRTGRTVHLYASTLRALGDGHNRGAVWMNDYIIARLAGRCANGAQRDGGKVFHAVPDIDGLGRPAEKAACGATYGRLSGGWDFTTPAHEVTCRRCLDRLGRSRVPVRLRATEGQPG